jgi:hypothetical protein
MKTALSTNPGRLFWLSYALAVGIFVVVGWRTVASDWYASTFDSQYMRVEYKDAWQLEETVTRWLEDFTNNEIPATYEPARQKMLLCQSTLRRLTSEGQSMSVAEHLSTLAKVRGDIKSLQPIGASVYKERHPWWKPYPAGLLFALGILAAIGFLVAWKSDNSASMRDEIHPSPARIYSGYNGPGNSETLTLLAIVSGEIEKAKISK